MVFVFIDLFFVLFKIYKKMLISVVIRNKIYLLFFLIVGVENESGVIGESMFFSRNDWIFYCCIDSCSGES